MADNRAAMARWDRLRAGKEDAQRFDEDFALFLEIRARQIPVVLMSAAACECAINAYLALKFDASEWKDLEWTPLVRKWTELPKANVPSYSLPQNLVGELESLVACRNAITHPKPEVREAPNHSIRHEGTTDDFHSPNELLVAQWYTLVIRLMDNLAKHDGSAGIFLNTYRENLLRG